MPTATDSLVHAEEPHAILAEGDNIYALSFNGFYFFPLDGQFGFWAQVELPGSGVIFCDGFELGDPSRWSAAVP